MTDVAEATAVTPAVSKTPARYFWIAGITLFLMAAAVAISVCRTKPEVWGVLLRDHGPALLGVPCAFLVATLVLATMRIFEGEIDFTFVAKGLKGAGAALIAWLSVFGAVVCAIRILW